MKLYKRLLRNIISHPIRYRTIKNQRDCNLFQYHFFSLELVVCCCASYKECFLTFLLTLADCLEGNKQFFLFYSNFYGFSASETESLPQILIPSYCRSCPVASFLNKSPTLSSKIYFPQAAGVVCYFEGTIETQSFTLDEGW